MLFNLKLLNSTYSFFHTIDFHQGLGGAVVVALYGLGFPSKSMRNKTSASGLSPNGEGFLVTPYLKILEIAMQEDQDNLIEKVRGTFGFRVTHGMFQSKILIL